MEVLDEHGNYGAVVRYTPDEWESYKKVHGVPEEDGDES